MIAVGKLITYCARSWPGFAEKVLQVLLLRFCGSSDQ